MSSVFEKYDSKSYPHRFTGSLLIHSIAGGIPSDPKIAEGWLRTKFDDPDQVIAEKAAELMVERGLDRDEALAAVSDLKHLNGFKRDDAGLYIERRHLMAAIKEAACVAVAVGKLPSRWGKTSKGIKGFVAEHICIIEDKLYLGVTEPTGINQSFPHTFRGTGIQYTEYVDEAKIDFTVKSDYDFKAEEWAHLWLTGEQQGIGAQRSQGYGRYEVTRWEKA